MLVVVCVFCFLWGVVVEGVKPWVLWRFVHLVVVVSCGGQSAALGPSASALVWWACSCSTGVSIPMAE